MGTHSVSLCFAKRLHYFLSASDPSSEKEPEPYGRRIKTMRRCAAAFWLLLACDFIMAALISLSSKRPMRGDEVTLHH